MALADLFKLHDPALEQTFNKKPYDAAKDRKAFNKSLDAVLDQVNNGRTKVPNRMWSGSNDVIEFKPSFKGRPISIMGETTFYIQEADFAQAIKTIKASVDAGELDDALEGSEGQGDGGSTGATTTRKPSKRGTGIGNTAKPNDPEWMKAFTDWAGEPDPSIVDPVPNSTATKWVSRAFAERGQKAKAAGGKKA